ncbi:hypothetical protein L2735_11380 [Shewanella olleyana]|uniref:antibiotic biosynthesis monooxygenase family protein n=1 Tax=Shewanella olleyana TaxID=135626 RepID=UPI00200D61C3|nr:hypothetical protein [Shewanella olleyana]MCL1067405.1 hypothetical protein [Shewanella olleyana]
MMDFHSYMVITVKHQKDCDVAKTWTERRCIEEAAETIPGFKYGEILEDPSEPLQTIVHCCWTNKSSYEEWLSSPVREKQEQDLAEYAPVLEFRNILLDSKHYVSV